MSIVDFKLYQKTFELNISTPFRYFLKSYLVYAFNIKAFISIFNLLSLFFSFVCLFLLSL